MAKKGSSKLTTLDFSILGLLVQNPMSGYGIRMMFEKTALASYSSSPGTIYPALKRMEKLVMIRRKELAEGNRGVFEITRKGVATLTKWITQPVTRDDVIRNLEILILRFAFMDVLVEKKEKKKFLNSFLDVLSQYTKELEDFRSSNFSTMPVSGRQAFEHGLESNKLTISWIERILSNL